MLDGTDWTSFIQVKSNGADPLGDVVSPEKRSQMMRGIRAKDTKPEMKLRKALFAKGFRYRLHSRQLPGKPDIVLKRWNAVIFVHGCFWHQHAGCRISRVPGTRPEYWIPKLGSNIARDLRNRKALLDAGWRVAIAWECGIRKNCPGVTNALDSWLRSESSEFAEFPASAHSP